MRTSRLPCDARRQTNKPLRRTRSEPVSAYLERELELLSGVRVVLALGDFAYRALCGHLRIRPRPKFGHGTEAPAPDGSLVVCSYHPSQQNTFTGSSQSRCSTPSSTEPSPLLELDRPPAQLSQAERGQPPWRRPLRSRATFSC